MSCPKQVQRIAGSVRKKADPNTEVNRPDLLPHSSWPTWSNDLCAISERTSCNVSHLASPRNWINCGLALKVPQFERSTFYIKRSVIAKCKTLDTAAKFLDSTSLFTKIYLRNANNESPVLFAPPTSNWVHLLEARLFHSQCFHHHSTRHHVGVQGFAFTRLEPLQFNFLRKLRSRPLKLGKFSWWVRLNISVTT